MGYNDFPGDNDAIREAAIAYRAERDRREGFTGVQPAVRQVWPVESNDAAGCDDGGQTYAPNAFSAHPDCEGVTKAAFKAAMERLLAGGQIRVAEDGPASKRRTFLEVAG